MISSAGVCHSCFFPSLPSMLFQDQRTIQEMPSRELCWQLRALDCSIFTILQGDRVPDRFDSDRIPPVQVESSVDYMILYSVSNKMMMRCCHPRENSKSWPACHLSIFSTFSSYQLFMTSSSTYPICGLSRTWLLPSTPHSVVLH